MKKTIITGLLILFIVGLLAIILVDSNNKKTQSVSVKNVPKIIFFYGNTCPHCKEFEKWMEENKIEQKLKIVKKEVYNNNNNAQELITAAKNCGLNTETIGVPFLYAKEKCYIGTPDIERYLSEKAGL